MKIKLLWGKCLLFCPVTKGHSVRLANCQRPSKVRSVFIGWTFHAMVRPAFMLCHLASAYLWYRKETYLGHSCLFKLWLY